MWLHPTHGTSLHSPKKHKTAGVTDFYCLVEIGWMTAEWRRRTSLKWRRGHHRAKFPWPILVQGRSHQPALQVLMAPPTVAVLPENYLLPLPSSLLFSSRLCQLSRRKARASFLWSFQGSFPHFYYGIKWRHLTHFFSNLPLPSLLPRVPCSHAAPCLTPSLFAVSQTLMF